MNKKFIVDFKSVGFEHWSYNLAYLTSITNLNSKIIVNSEFYNFFIDYFNNPIESIRIIKYKYLRNLQAIFRAFYFIGGKNEIEFLNLGRYELFIILLLNNSNYHVVHIHNEILTFLRSKSLLSLYTKYLIRTSKIRFVCQTSIIRKWFNLYISKTPNQIIIIPHKLINKSILEKLINHKNSAISKELLIGSDRKLLHNNNINVMSLRDNYASVSDYITTIYNSRAIDINLMNDIYRFGCTGTLSDSNYARNAKINIFTNSVYLRIKYKDKNNFFLNDLPDLHIRFGSLGDVFILLSNISNKNSGVIFNRKSFFNSTSINLNSIVGILKLKNLFSISSFFDIIKHRKRYNNVVFYPHPNHNKYVLLFFKILFVFLKKRFYIRFNKLSQYILNNNFDNLSQILCDTGGYIAFVPFSAENSKNISIDYIYKILNILEKKNYKVLILSDRYISLNSNNFFNIVNLSGNTNLYSFIDYIRNASSVISVDTSAIHIAKYFNIRTYAIHSSRLIPNYWMTFGDNIYNFKKILDCSGCNSKNCKKIDVRCINNTELLNFISENV